jgi:hypothetical protein
MAYFLSVAPFHILDQLFRSREYNEAYSGKQCLLLAHDVVKRKIDYDKLFRSNRSPSDRIIMDNSAYELKASVDTQMVWDAVNIVRPDCVVLPDVYLDGKATWEATREVYEDWIERRNKAPQAGPALMAIPQGKTFEEWVWCAEQLSTLKHVHWWGIPRNYREVLGRSRVEAVKIARLFAPYRQVHLFGFSNDYLDDAIAARTLYGGSTHVESIDSTTPLRAASSEIDFSIVPGAMDDLGPRGDWWESAKWSPRIFSNLAYTNKVF